MRLAYGGGNQVLDVADGMVRRPDRCNVTASACVIGLEIGCEVLSVCRWRGSAR